MQSVLKRVNLRIRRFLGLSIPNFNIFERMVRGKRGLEIGGPSSTFDSPTALPIYGAIGALDNCDFSSNTVWADHGAEFVFSASRPTGRSYFCEGSELTPIASETYDFVLSCHNLEHFANPIKALMEWKRVLRPGGVLIVVLPYYVNTFDRFRQPTPVADMWADYDTQVGEDDLSHLAEILEKHDLSRDAGAGTFEEFERRCRDNFHHRCLHHHVFDEHNGEELLASVGFEVLAAEAAGSLYLLGRLPLESGL